jgi:hypothetical protein
MQQTCGSHERSRSALFQYGLDPGALRPERNGFRLGTRCIARRQAIFPWSKSCELCCSKWRPGRPPHCWYRHGWLSLRYHVTTAAVPRRNGSPHLSRLRLSYLRQQAVSRRVQSTGIPWRANGSCRIYRSCLAMLARPLLVKHLR